MRQPVFPYPISVKTWPNGLRTVFVPFNSPGVAAFYSLVRTGSRNETEPGRTGFAHFFEHMMFRGTPSHPSEERDQLLSAAGVTTNAFTTDDFTAYHAYGPASRLPLIIELEADRFQNLSYSVEDFKTESRAVLGEYNKNFSNPMQKLDEVFSDTAFTAHTYKHTTMGFKRDIEGMPELFDYSRTFFERWYTPSNTTLIVVGDFVQGEIERIIQQHYGAWARPETKVVIPPEPKQTAPRYANIRWDNPTPPRLMLGWHTPAAIAPDSTPSKDAAIQNVLAPYLFGETSPVFNDLVLDRQLVLDLGPSYYDHRDPNTFGVVSTLKDEASFAPVREAIGAAVAELQSGKVDAGRLAAIKSNHKYALLGSLDNAEAIAEVLVFSMAASGAPDAIETQFRLLDAITPTDLVAFAKKHLVDTNQTLVTLVAPGQNPPADVPDYQPSAR